MVSDLAIVIQGESKYVELLKSAFKGYNTIFSTWEGEESKYSSDDKVIYNNEIVLYNRYEDYNKDDHNF